uniref:Bestrophin homolog n=1 Tax=Gongylonema pulchrum TaxID=637853 RepID=A0A183EWE7_9BILA
LIIEAYDPVLVIRFIALQCVVAGGLKSATFNSYERLFVQVRYWVY